MQISRIVLHADASDSFHSRAAVATGLIRQTDASLVAVHGLPRHAAIQAEFTMPREMWNSYKELHWGYENRSREIMQAQADIDKIEFSWSRYDDDVIAAIAERSRLADLIVLSRLNRDAPEKGAAVDPGEVITTCDRPCLIVPLETSPEWSPKKIAIAWNGSDQSAKAVRESLALLTQADEVRVVQVSGDASFKETEFLALQEYFEQHGVKASFDAQLNESSSEAESLELYCRDRKMNLMVMGAYGHRRRFEQIFGGVTNSVLKKFSIPVLMVH